MKDKIKVVKNYLRRTVLENYFAFVSAFFTILISVQFYLYPTLFLGKRFYEEFGAGSSMAIILQTVFFVSSILIIFGILKENPRIVRNCVAMLNAAWAGYAMLLLVAPPPNARWLYSLYFFAVIVGISIKEVRLIE